MQNKDYGHLRFSQLKSRFELNDCWGNLKRLDIGQTVFQLMETGGFNSSSFVRWIWKLMIDV